MHGAVDAGADGRRPGSRNNFACLLLDPRTAWVSRRNSFVSFLAKPFSIEVKAREKQNYICTSIDCGGKKVVEVIGMVSPRTYGILRSSFQRNKEAYLRMLKMTFSFFCRRGILNNKKRLKNMLSHMLEKYSWLFVVKLN